jgi:hypothetical protein
MAKLTINENPQGFTDTLTITFEDFSVANAGTLADRATKTFTYVIPAGSLVTKCSAHLVTAFDDSGSGDDLTITVGDGDDADGYLTAADIHTDATEITYVANTGALLDNENGKVYTAADTIDILFSPDTDNDAPYSLNELTAGEIKLKFEICDLN